MIDPTTRPAEATELDPRLPLEAEARAGLVGQRGGDRWLATHPERGDRWGDDLGGTFVAQIDDVIVGYLVVSIDGDLATINEVYVLSETRELGFGDALLAEAIGHARSAGAGLLEGESLPGDRETKNLYERAGIKARLITVSAPI